MRVDVLYFIILFTLLLASCADRGLAEDLNSQQYEYQLSKVSEEATSVDSYFRNANENGDVQWQKFDPKNCENLNLRDSQLGSIPDMFVKSMPVDYMKGKGVWERKTTFVCVLLPHIVLANKRILKDRRQLLEIFGYMERHSHSDLHKQDLVFLESLAQEYRVDVESSQLKQVVVALLAKVDSISPSLILAQAANESAWGTSRFSISCNNLFGRWAFSTNNRDCLSRGSGRKIPLKDYEDIGIAVYDQLVYLNSHTNYKDLRIARQEASLQGQTANSRDLLDGLLTYSAKGEKYIEELWAIMSYNNFQKFDSL